MKILITLILLVSTQAYSLEFNDSRVIRVDSHTVAGTAFNVVAPSGRVYLVTNAHVCGNNTVLFSNDGDTSHLHLLVKLYKKADLCILTTLSTSGLKLAETYHKKEPIQTLGNPLLVRTLTSGTLKNFGNDGKDYVLVIDRLLAPGASGSPIVNSKDEVIGVIEAIPVDGVTVESYAVPLEFLKDALSDL